MAALRATDGAGDSFAAFLVVGPAHPGPVAQEILSVGRPIPLRSCLSRLSRNRLVGAAPAALLVAAVPLSCCSLSVKCGRRRFKRRQRLLALRRKAAPTEPYPAGVYDPAAAAAYFASKPIELASRTSQCAWAGFNFGAKLLMDKRSGEEARNARVRAEELCALLTQLGPTFIKIGQALSIRADLLSPTYLEALSKLQSAVPPVPTDEAMETLETELGKPVEELFTQFTDEPVASASIGQVYRARLRDGREVAVKVQRPGIEETVALDLHLLRIGVEPLKEILMQFLPMNQDWVGLVDTWGLGFVDELDYHREAANAVQFMDTIQKTPLGGAVSVPEVVPEYTTRKVLTTEWVQGSRLEESPEEDITKLCSVAMNTYLTMLLEIGVLHADPHPGNLLRMPDGRLCILDWGLVTRIDEETQVTLIEHVADLVAREYGNLPTALVALGFVPEGKEHDIGESAVVDELAEMFREWTDGGGAVNKVLTTLQDLSAKYGNIFRIPPYFFYIARAFIVLEGIGLSNDPGYSVIGECLPYVSKRILSDPSPRVASALATFVYGDERENLDRQVKTEKVNGLASGLSAYMSATDGLKDKSDDSPVMAASAIVDKMAELLLGDTSATGKGPTPLQELLAEELAKVLGAGARQTLAAMGFFKQEHSKDLEGREPLPDETDDRWTFLEVDDVDRRTLSTAGELAAMAEPQVRPLVDAFRQMSMNDKVAVAGGVLSKLWEYRGPAAATGGLVAVKMFTQGLLRVGRQAGEAGLRRTQSRAADAGTPVPKPIEKTPEVPSTALAKPELPSGALAVGE